MTSPEPNNRTLNLSWWRIFPWVVTFLIGIKRVVKNQDGWITWGALIVGAAGIAFELWLRFRAASQKAEDDDDAPIRSLVFLLSEPREVELEGAWVQQLGTALGQPLNIDGGDSKAFLMPFPHPAIEPGVGECFMLKIREGAFWILNMQKPYMDDPEDFAKTIVDARLRDAISRHKAWISVDLVGWEGKFDQQAVYAVLGKSISVLAGPDVVAVYCPELQRCNEFDPALLSQLAGDNPLEIFEDSTFSPVITIDDEDEQLEAAKEEARRRWPEFVALFKDRDLSKELPFIVKAPFSDKAKTEFMWMEVTELDDELLTGTLANTPHELVGFREGQTVTIPTGSVVDWMCLGRDGKPLGGWTNEVLARQAKRRK